MSKMTSEGPIRPTPWCYNAEKLRLVEQPSAAEAEESSYGPWYHRCGEIEGSRACIRSRMHRKCMGCRKERCLCTCILPEARSTHTDSTEFGLTNRDRRDPDRRRIKRRRSR